ncbi:FAD-dependent oxidoreductase [Actinocorallia aurea]
MERTGCVVIGGGPAGMVLGLLLARAGVQVTVLEKHGDFLRDFRGDTVHPSTLRLLDELGLGERFERLPYSKVRKAAFPLSDGRELVLSDFGRLRRMAHPYIAMVPQWHLLNLLADAAREERGFALRMHTEATGLIRENGRVAGVRYRGPDGAGELRADLTVACDGRWSLARREAGLVPREFPVPLDTWWFRLPTEADVAPTLTPRTAPGRTLIPIPREGYLQIGYLGRKGGDAALRARGIEAFRREVAALMPFADVSALTSMDDVKHLDVRLNRLRRWHVPGLLCIGDAAHAMSPVGGVGINLAVQDAVAAASRLARPLLRHRVTDRDLAAVQRRRLLPTIVVQALQRMLHRRLIVPIINGETAAPPAGFLALLERFPALSAVPAYLVGVGILPEHAPAFARRPAPPTPTRRPRPRSRT